MGDKTEKIWAIDKRDDTSCLNPWYDTDVWGGTEYTRTDLTIEALLERVFYHMGHVTLTRVGGDTYIAKIVSPEKTVLGKAPTPAEAIKAALEQMEKEDE